MIEDFEGYNGKVTDYTWEYAGTRNLLMPFYYHNDMNWRASLKMTLTDTNSSM